MTKESRTTESTSAADDGRDALRKLSNRFRREQSERAKEIRAELGKPGGKAQLLNELAAQEAALVERIIEVEAQLLSRVLMLVDSPSTALQVQATLKPLVATHRNIAERVESFLAAAAAVAAAEANPAREHLRRVA